MPDDTETIALRATVIGGNGYPDDYQVVWRGRSIGRIMKGTGSPNHAPQWWWECNTYGQPPLGDHSGTGVDLYDCKAKFEVAWAPIRDRHTDEEIVTASRDAEANAAALARYDRKRGSSRIAQGHPGGFMNWGQFVRHTAIAISVTFVVVAGIYLAVRFTLFDL
jgi:hypothetical protein